MFSLVTKVPSGVFHKYEIHLVLARAFLQLILGGLVTFIQTGTNFVLWCHSENELNTFDEYILDGMHFILTFLTFLHFEV